jgi:hypothetical protein
MSFNPDERNDMDTNELWNEIRQLVAGEGEAAETFNECFANAAAEAGFEATDADREQLLAEIVITRLALVIQNSPGSDTYGAPLFIVLGKLAGDMHQKEQEMVYQAVSMAQNFMSTASDIASLPTTEVEG